mmetsp:Transcript_73953/g.176009  ORF Transcript_73953/g.176009 Transcript_73953/m.176009 type:complete len:192 (+) Transcript_73953:75-650(+)
MHAMWEVPLTVFDRPRLMDFVYKEDKEDCEVFDIASEASTDVEDDEWVDVAAVQLPGRKPTQRRYQEDYNDEPISICTQSLESCVQEDYLVQTTSASGDATPRGAEGAAEAHLRTASATEDRVCPVYDMAYDDDEESCGSSDADDEEFLDVMEDHEELLRARVIEKLRADLILWHSRRSHVPVISSFHTTY